MITTNTVLILGAGASSHLGYPIGQKLIQEICSRIKTMPHSSEICSLFAREQIDDFGERLGRSGCDSIDSFLEYNTEDMELGCVLIADCLKEKENWASLHPDKAGWYRHFFNSIASKSPEDLAAAPVTIVTFNYDRSVEAYIHQCIANRYHLPEDEATDILRRMRIIHLHGTIGDYPAIPYKPGLDGVSISAIGSSIRIIHQFAETEGEFCSEGFLAAHAALQSAERVYFLGFGFHSDNIRRFRFFSVDSLHGKLVRSTAFEMGSVAKAALVRRLTAYGFTDKMFGVDPFACNDFFKHIAALE